MYPKDSLWYLIFALIDNKYDINTFCNEFTRIYDLELDYSQLNIIEHKNFKELSEMTGRFSDDEEELKIPKMYVSEEEVRKKVKQIISIVNPK